LLNGNNKFSSFAIGDVSGEIGHLDFELPQVELSGILGFTQWFLH